MTHTPKVGDEGFAVHRGFRFRARVLTVVTGRRGPSLVVTAIDSADWHRLPASSVCVEPHEFVHRDTCLDCGGSGGVEPDGILQTCTRCMGKGRLERAAQGGGA